MVAAGSLVAFEASANGLRLGSGGASRQEVQRNQARLIDSRLASQYSASERYLPRLPQPVDGPGSQAGVPSYRGSYSGPYLDMARAAARRHNIPEDLFLRLVHQESRWDPGAVSRAGARGLAQLMPDTAALLGVNADDPQQNLEGGARYLRMMFERFGDWRLALAAYNAGPGAVDQHGGEVPPFAETRDYIRRILGG